MNWNQNLPKPVVRNLMKHEKPVNHITKLPVATSHAKTPVARTNTTKPTNTYKHYIIPTITVVFGGAHIRITHFPVEHWTPKHISDGRVRKQFLRDWREPDVEIDNSKQENLANLVKELEAEQKAKHNITEQEKQYNIGVMLQHARVQSYDYKINQAAIEYDINTDMVAYFNTQEQELLRRYADVIVAKNKAMLRARRTKQKKTTQPNRPPKKDNKGKLATVAKQQERECREIRATLGRMRGFSITNLLSNNNQK